MTSLYYGYQDRDYLFDLQAGRAAGLFCVYLDRKGSQMWQDHADLTLTRLDRILDDLRNTRVDLRQGLLASNALALCKFRIGAVDGLPHLVAGTVRADLVAG